MISIFDIDGYRKIYLVYRLWQFSLSLSLSLFSIVAHILMITEFVKIIPVPIERAHVSFRSDNQPQCL